MSAFSLSSITQRDSSHLDSRDAKDNGEETKMSVSDLDLTQNKAIRPSSLNSEESSEKTNFHSKSLGLTQNDQTYTPFQETLPEKTASIMLDEFTFLSDEARSGRYLARNAYKVLAKQLVQGFESIPGKLYQR